MKYFFAMIDHSSSDNIFTNEKWNVVVAELCIKAENNAAILLQAGGGGVGAFEVFVQAEAVTRSSVYRRSESLHCCAEG